MRISVIALAETAAKTFEAEQLKQSEGLFTPDVYQMQGTVPCLALSKLFSTKQGLA